jgi:hypothetical protein
MSDLLRADKMKRQARFFNLGALWQVQRINVHMLRIARTEQESGWPQWAVNADDELMRIRQSIKRRLP